MTTAPSPQAIAKARYSELCHLVDHTAGLYRFLYDYPCRIGHDNVDEVRLAVGEFFAGHSQSQAA